VAQKVALHARSVYLKKIDTINFVLYCNVM